MKRSEPTFASAGARESRPLAISSRSAWTERASSYVALCVSLGVLALAPSALMAGKKKVIIRVVTGEVLDASQNPIVGATVQLTDVQTGKKSEIYSDSTGHYEFSGIKQDRDYKVQATFKGVVSEIREASSFDTRDTIVLNLQIPPPKE